jgi:hypothetical protein
MFAKSKQIGLVSLLLVLGAMMGGCAESVGNEPASFPGASHTPALVARTQPPPQVSEESFRIARIETVAPQVDSKHSATRPIANVH